MDSASTVVISTYSLINKSNEEDNHKQNCRTKMSTATPTQSTSTNITMTNKTV